MGETQFFIGALAKTSGLTPDTIRYYEEVGVIPAPARSPGGYRVYSAADAERLEFVGQAQALGLSLEEIREVLAMTDRGIEPCDHVQDRLRQRLSEVERRINELKALRGRLQGALQEAERSGGSDMCRCRIIEGDDGRVVQIGATARALQGFRNRRERTRKE